MDIFSERLREALKMNDMSQAELARLIHMSQNVINNYCTGRREPPLCILCLISKAVNKSTDYLLGLVD